MAEPGSSDVRPVEPPEPGEIINIADMRTERLSIRSPQEPRACAHRRSRIDDKLRIVECRDCGERLDPIEVLLDIAKNWRHESWAAERIRDHEAKERAKELERRQRHVRLHMRCHGCGLETRLTVGKLTADDLAAWERHFAQGLVPEHEETWGARTYTVPARLHRRETPEDVARAAAGIRDPDLPDGARGSTTFVDRRPREP